MVIGELSREYFRRLAERVPGGVMSPSRSYTPMGLDDTLVMARGVGTYLFDVDGRRYLDCLGAFGPGIFGHAHPVITEAIRRQAGEGVLYGTACRLELELVERVQEAIPELEMVRIVSTGTEAVMSAVRLCRAATGRRRIVKFAGDYHGHFDAVLAESGSGAALVGGEGAAGVPPGVAEDVLTLPYNDGEAAERLLSAIGDEVAAVLVEPISGNMGVVWPQADFLYRLRAACDRVGALLVYDEVILGFRLRYGAAFPLVGPKPDLIVLGKVLGGGLPIGLYGGRRDLMRLLVPLGPVFQAGTHAGNPLTMAAALAGLDVLREEGVYDRLDSLAELWLEGMSELCRRYPVSLEHAGSMLSLFFRPTPPRHYEEAKAQDTGAYARFFRAMLAQGVVLPPSPLETWFLNLQMEESHIEFAVEAARSAMAEAYGGV